MPYIIFPYGWELVLINRILVGFEAILGKKLYLEEEKLDIVYGKDGPAVIHVLLQVSLQVFKHKGQRLVRVHDVVEGHWK